MTIIPTFLLDIILMIKSSYNFQDFFLHLKSRHWDTFETFLQLDEFVVLLDFFPKSAFHFLVLSKSSLANNLLEVTAADLPMFQKKESLARDLVASLTRLSL